MSGKIGQGSLEAAARLGLRELRGALYPESNVAQPSELGMYGTAIQSEIREARKVEEPEQELDR